MKGLATSPMPTFPDFGSIDTDTNMATTTTGTTTGTTIRPLPAMSLAITAAPTITATTATPIGTSRSCSR